MPFGFFSAVLPPEMSNSTVEVSDAAVDQQFARMARSGVEAVRMTSDWGKDLEPAPGAYDFSTLDRMVGSAARYRIASLVNVTATPRWASILPMSPEHWRYPPTSPGPFAELMRRLVLRYGPQGTFWTENPSLPRVPVQPVADLERAERSVALDAAALGAGLHRSASGRLPGDQGR